MQKTDCFELGYIAKSHGLDGKVQAFFDVEDPSMYSKIDAVFLEINNALVPFFIENIYTFDATRYLFKFEDINCKDDADELKGSKLFLPANLLPQLDESRFYFHDVIGFDVEDEVKGKIGLVKEFVDAGPQVIMVVTFGEKEILIPFHDDFIVEVDKSAKLFKMKLPNGLVDLYLEE